jgi:3-dehydroquinate dehydratase type I
LKEGKRDFGRGGQGARPAAPFLNPTHQLRLCVPVVEPTVPRARNLYLRAARRGLWAEIRLDYLAKPDVKKLFRTLPGQVIATNRLATEGGKWPGTEAERRRLLEEALALGVHFVDVELASDAGWRGELYSRRGKTRLILSWHDFSGTPDDGVLAKVFSDMLAAEADVLKIVTYAEAPEDNLRVLSLIPRARVANREIIAFCMGPLGTWSRVAAPFLGGFLSFAPFNRRGASAPGQITVNEMRRLWKGLK